MEKLRVGIIGCGNIANGKHMPSIQEVDVFEMVAFCDIIPERAEAAAKKFGTPDAKVYTDYRELLKDESINNVRVLTHNDNHAEISIAAMRAGKHVLCEKPMAANYAEALEMYNVHKETGMILTIGYQHKLDPDVLYAKAEAAKDTFGEMYYAHANVVRRRGVPTHGAFLMKEKQGGGALIDVGTHAVDTTLYIMDNYKPKMVLGATFDKLKHNPEQGNPLGNWDTENYDVEEFASGFLVMENGATVVVEASWALNVRENTGVRYKISGTKAGLDNYDGFLKINGVNNNQQYLHEVDFKGGQVAFVANAVDDLPRVKEQKVFANAILGKGELVTTPESALVVSHILEGIYISAKTGKPYYFND
ncbi:MAG: Gfo/Idh/MocA family oxidoreductase [Clostridia bacterium]|nr:Gfo/Idh/MocA family oxidoreductase [Clostridia bacterium]